MIPPEKTNFETQLMCSQSFSYKTRLRVFMYKGLCLNVQLFVLEHLVVKLNQ